MRFAYLCAENDMIDGDHTREWSPPYAHMAACICAYAHRLLIMIYYKTGQTHQNILAQMIEFHTNLTNLTDCASLRPRLSALPPTRNERRLRRLPVYRHKGVQLAAYCSRMANASVTMRSL